MIVAHDNDWQFPTITEKHAYINAKVHLKPFEHVVYVGFPWATLIDLLIHQKKESEQLLEYLSGLREKLAGFTSKVTVCQHIAMKRYMHLFESIGITYVFWSHTIKKEPHFPDHPDINILPFPLYPVNVARNVSKYTDRQYLFSFVGAKSNQFYLTDIRNQIIDHLSADQRASIAGRENWHFNKIVYDHQIHHASENLDGLLDTMAEFDFVKAMESSVFTLCPSGTGPNSIRLWESLGSGVIPVILSDHYLPPGNLDLWYEACIFCGESQEEIKLLGDRLQDVYENEELVTRKLAACKQLWSLYGSDFFIYDILAKFLELEQASRLEHSSVSQMNFGIVTGLLSEVLDGKVLSAHKKQVCIISFVTNVLLDTEASLAYLEMNEQFIAAIKKLIQECDEITRKHTQNVFRVKGIPLLLESRC